ncbi:hypothetical protein J6590_067525 [Homalodisca vitripennis]|nr:hypothetical protein J6590_067525 [Homalodisca vitripennis]
MDCGPAIQMSNRRRPELEEYRSSDGTNGATATGNRNWSDRYCSWPAPSVSSRGRPALPIKPETTAIPKYSCVCLIMATHYLPLARVLRIIIPLFVHPSRTGHPIRRSTTNPGVDFRSPKSILWALLSSEFRRQLQNLAFEIRLSNLIEVVSFAVFAENADE